MKNRVLIVHTQDQYLLALILTRVLVASGYRNTICSQDLFDRNTYAQINEDLEPIYSATSAYIILGSPGLFASGLHSRITHHTLSMKRAIQILADDSMPHPSWFKPKIVIGSKPNERVWNQVIELIRPLIHNQPPIIHPNLAPAFNLH